ncbi:MAG: nitroreductase family deazaflavin-dependent oxidoreductase [Chloroflexota bacterium]
MTARTQSSERRKLGRPPRGFQAKMARLPIQLCKHGFGWVLGSRFLMLIHRGRKTGRKRYAVLEVVARDREHGRYFVASPWHERADWFANVLADPNVTIVVGRHRIKAKAKVLPTDDSMRILRDYGRRHRFAAKALARLFGYPDFLALVQTLQVVEFDRVMYCPGDSHLAPRPPT